MTHGRSIAGRVSLSIAAVLMCVASPPAVWSAPPAHASKDKPKDSTDQPKPNRGRWSDGSNTAPTISGTPATSVLQIDNYSFEPTAYDADKDTLSFTVTHLPRWATFDATSGRLFGTPGVGDVGLYSDIVIAVSDGQASTALPSFDIEVLAYANETAMLTWIAPTANTDGSPLLNLAGYRVYWGPESRSYTDFVEISNPGVTTYVIDNLTTGTHYFAVTAMNAQGVESTFSNEGVTTIVP